MTLAEMLDDLPRDCDVGAKKNSKGDKETWVGYQLHIDAADGQIPIGCMLEVCSLAKRSFSPPGMTSYVPQPRWYFCLLRASMQDSRSRQTPHRA